MIQNCSAFIYLRINDERNKLEISKMVDEHNHQTSEKLYNNLSKQRQLAPQTKFEIMELMEMKANKKLIQYKVMSDTGKVVTLRDLSNIFSKGTSILYHITFLTKSVVFNF